MHLPNLWYGLHRPENDLFAKGVIHSYPLIRSPCLERLEGHYFDTAMLPGTLPMIYPIADHLIHLRQDNGSGGLI